MSNGTPNEDLGKTSSGMSPKAAAALAYLLGIITGIVFMLMERENKFVKFHAVQSIGFSIAYAVILLTVGFLPGIGGLAEGLVQIAGCVVWITLMVKACKGRWFRLPVIGDVAAKQAGLS